MDETQRQNLARKTLIAAAVILFIVLPVWLGLEHRNGPVRQTPQEGAEDGDVPHTGLYILEGPEIRKTGEKFVIEWTTSRPADSVVRFGKADSFGNLLTKGEAFVKKHRVELPDIPYVWLYSFWIVSQDRHRHEVSTTFGPDNWSEGAALADVSGEYPLLCRPASAAFWADFDGDLDMDVLLVDTPDRHRQARLLCREDTGYRDCTNRLRLRSGAGRIKKVDWADFDRDGYPDLLACCQGLVVCQNYGPPAYRLGRATTLIEVGQESPVVASVFVQADRDQLVDVVALQADGSFRVYRNVGPPFPQFERARDLEPETLTLTASGDTFRSMATADFNGDGREDLILLPQGQILHGSDQGYSLVDQALGILPEHSIAAVACEDFDSDYDSDVFAILSTEKGGFAGFRLFRNEGEGFLDVTESSGDLNAVQTEVSCATWADLTGDGNPDLILGTQDGEIKVLLSDGNGSFTEATEAFGVELDRDEPVQHVSSIDIAGTDRVDIFVTFSAGGGVVLRNRFAEWAPRRFLNQDVNPTQN